MDFAQYLPTFGGQEQMPQDDTMMQLELKRKFALADALKNQAMPQGQMVGDRYVAPSWTQYLANAVGKYQGGQAENEAMKQYGDYRTAENARMAEALGKFGKAFEPTTTTNTTYAPGVGKELAVGDTVQTAPNYSPTSNANEMVAPTSPYGTQSMMGNAVTSVPTTTTSTVQPTDASMRQAFNQYAIDTKNPKLAEQLMMGDYEAQRKRNAPYELAAGATRYEGGTNRVIATNPKDAKPVEQWSAPFEYNGQVVQKNLATGKLDQPVHQPAQTQISVGQPIQAINPKTGQPEFVQFPNKPGQQPQFTGVAPPGAKLKEVPSTQRGAYSGNEASLKTIDAAIKATENAPDEYFGLRGGMGNAYMSRLYPKSVDVRQRITGVGAAKRHELSGSAVTPSENQYTAPLLPQPTDDKQTTLTKLKGLRENYQQLNDSIANSFGEEYTPLNAGKSPSTYHYDAQGNLIK